jgi:indole-3-glycerol phosphate synthase
MKYGILFEIAEKTRERVQDLQKRESLIEVKKRAQRARVPHDFRAAFLSSGTHIIAEIKFASPSEGILAAGKAPVQVAEEYLKNGATALSVLTEPYYFEGSTEYLENIRARFPEARLLMKDFIVDAYQLFLARAIGADAVLILLAMLEKAQAQRFFEEARALGLTPLVEVHTEEELRLAISMKADFIGINNRNLKTMEVSLATSQALASQAPKDCVLISESGIKTGKELKALQTIGYRGFLMGTHLMKSESPGAALKKILMERECL